MCLHPPPPPQGSFTYEKDFVTVGPWGGRGGRHWDDGVQDSVREIIITYGSGIDSIIFLYEKQGNVYTSNKHGGNGGNHTQKVKLNYPEEYLLAMRGFYGPIFGHDGPVCVRSLTFVSNVRDYGPFGVEQGHSFTFQMGCGQILGFYGKDGGYLDSIGAYVKHICPHNPPQALESPKKSGCSIIEGNIADKYDVLSIKLPENPSSGNPSIPAAEVSKSNAASEKDNQMQNRSGAFGGIVSYGPWGGNCGAVFDDGKSFTGIKQILILYNEDAGLFDVDTIVGIRVLYEGNGKFVWGGYHGGSVRDCQAKRVRPTQIDLDYPNESLTSISGYFSLTKFDGPAVISSLTFYTSKGKKYGPYGDEVEVPFSTNSTEGTIVGIHGRADDECLVAIGVHVKKGKLNSIGSPSESDV